MPKLRSAAPSLLLGTTQAGGNLTLAATAWMVSGLTPSPLLNSLLPALGALPLLLQLKRHPKGYGLQLLAVVLLIAISLSIGPKTASQTWPLLGCYAAVVLFGFGREVSTLPIERRLLSSSNTTMQRLRRGQDMGTLVGNLLAALLFPAIRQFLPALLLLLPMTGVAARGEQSLEPVPSPLPQRLPFDPRCMLQGLVLGGLFALLALMTVPKSSLDWLVHLIASALARPICLSPIHAFRQQKLLHVKCVVRKWTLALALR